MSHVVQIQTEVRDIVAVRLIHHSVIIELNIPSYRLEEAKKSQPKSTVSQAGSKT